MSRVKRLSIESKSNEWTVNSTYTEMKVTDSIRFTIPEYYPFKSPILLIEGVPHVQYLKRLYTRRKSLIDSQKYCIPCICCSTILCSWSPCNTCIQVYEEYTQYATQMSYIDLLQNMKQMNLDDLILEKISTFLL